MKLQLAPLQGYADNAYRLLHSQIYGGIDCYYTPFIRIEKGEPRRQDMARLALCVGDGMSLVPQIIFNSVDEFRTLVAAVKALGYRRIDLNLGCPYPMQTGHGRGAALIANLPLMRQIADIIAADADTSYSIKMRLGIDDPTQWQALMPVLNSMPLAHIAMHPRVAKQKYAGELNLDQMEAFISQSQNPVIWNGDIATTAQIYQVAAAHPTLAGVMIGRGLLARPSLAAEWRSGQEWPRDRRISTLLDFHDRLLEIYSSTLCGPTQILQKIKPFWDYLEPEFGRRALKPLLKATTLQKYTSCLAELKELI